MGSCRALNAILLVQIQPGDFSLFLFDLGRQCNGNTSRLHREIRVRLSPYPLDFIEDLEYALVAEQVRATVLEIVFDVGSNPTKGTVDEAEVVGGNSLWNYSQWVQLPSSTLCIVIEFGTNDYEK